MPVGKGSIENMCVYIHIYIYIKNIYIYVKLNIQKTKIMASSPITSWEIDGETVETVSDFIVLGSKMQIVTAAIKLKDAYSLEEKLWPT